MKDMNYFLQVFSNVMTRSIVNCFGNIWNLVQSTLLLYGCLLFINLVSECSGKAYKIFVCQGKDAIENYLKH